MIGKVFSDLTGVGYEPVALLATQVVAGTNYRFLCKKAVVVPGAKATFAFVDVSKDLDGNFFLATSDGFDGIFSTSIEALPEGWTAPESPVIPEKYLLVIQAKAAELKGATITPVAFVGQQKVSDTEFNFAFVCEHASKISDPGDAPSYCFIYANVKIGADGTVTADITDNKIVSDNGALS